MPTKFRGRESPVSGPATNNPHACPDVKSNWSEKPKELIAARADILSFPLVVFVVASRVRKQILKQRGPLDL